MVVFINEIDKYIWSLVMEEFVSLGFDIVNFRCVDI